MYFQMSDHVIGDAALQKHSVVGNFQPVITEYIHSVTD